MLCIVQDKDGTPRTLYVSITPQVLQEYIDKFRTVSESGDVDALIKYLKLKRIIVEDQPIVIAAIFNI